MYINLARFFVIFKMTTACMNFTLCMPVYVCAYMF